MRPLIENLLFRTIVLATLTITAALFAAQLSRELPSHDEVTGNSQPHASKQTKHEVEEKVVFELSAESWTAAFTGVLAVFTMVLAAITYRLFQVTRDGIAEQAGLTRDSLEKTERSVQAAERALEGADAPYLDVAPTLHLRFSQYIGSGFERKNVITEAADYIIRNYGKSPAFVLEIYQGIALLRTSPDPMTFPPTQSNLLHQMTIGPDAASKRRAVSIFSGDIKNFSDWIEGRAFKNETAWLVVQIRYRDVFGSQFLSGFNLAYNRYSSEFYAVGGPQHNYRRKLTPDELIIAEKRDTYPVGRA